MEILASAVMAFWLLTSSIYLPIMVRTQPAATIQVPDFVLYDDALHPSWENWSWETVIKTNETGRVFSGRQGLSVRYTSGWAGMFLGTHDHVALSNYQALRFWVYSENGRQRVQLTAIDSGGIGGTAIPLSLQAGQWNKVELTFEQLGIAGNLGGIMIQDTTGSAQDAFVLDELVLVGAIVPDEQTPATTVALAIDVDAPQHAISPYIYGLNFADEALAAELNLPLNRWGGNAVTRYNYEIDVSNRGLDWFFENIASNVDESQLPFGSTADSFVANNNNRNTASMMTMPMIGWTPKDRSPSCAFSVSKYGPQQYTDSWRPDCGNGNHPDGTPITGNDPHDVSKPIDKGYVAAWMRHLLGLFDSADSGGVQFYQLDNEPMLWSSTHRDVHPEPVGYDELIDRSLEYADTIRSTDPSASIVGPSLWGWTAYFYSGIDAASGDWNNPPDRLAHGDMPLAPWYLQQMAQHEAETNTRLLDYFDLHYYPQNGGVPLNIAGSRAIQEMRLRSTRSLWDPTYVDETWIAEPVQLIPRMRGWVDQYYPGTGTSLSEYNFGGLEHINGALAQADVLGIFGRERLDMAMMWAPPTTDQPGAYALRMYRNYNGFGGAFGDVSLLANSSDQEAVSVYAARRSADNAITVMVINKAMAPATAIIGLNNLTTPTATEVYEYSANNLDRIVRQPDVTLSSASQSFDLPADSITLFVVNAD